MVVVFLGRSPDLWKCTAGGEIHLPEKKLLGFFKLCISSQKVRKRYPRKQKNMQRKTVSLSCFLSAPSEAGVNMHCRNEGRRGFHGFEKTRASAWGLSS